MSLFNDSEAWAVEKGKPPVTPPNTLCSQPLDYHNNCTNAMTHTNRWLSTHCVCSGLALISASGETSLLCWHFLWMFKQELPHPGEEQVLVMLGFLGYNHLCNLDHSLSLVIHFTGGNWVWKELGNPCKVSVLVKMTKLFIQRQLWILRPSNLLNKLASVKK